MGVPIATDKRKNKIISVVSARQYSLTVVLENIHDPHNVSAILRTCDAVGIPKVSLLYNVEKFPRIGKKSSASANKWIERDKFTTVEECYANLRNNGFLVYASSLNTDSKSLYELNLTKEIAIILGNEHRGISQEAEEQADKTFYIPMYGMVQSLNVSVAAAVILYEALRQRKLKGMYDKSQLSSKELENKIKEWIIKK
jgi:tRNA (guanosine-2'-O-)-methyltransferase